MSALYKLTKSDSGSYLFTTDGGLDYTVFFIECPVTDIEGNNHTVYSFGFERAGNFETGKFSSSFDEKIKATIIHIIKVFFDKNGEKAILYFCYDDDGFARHRSIIFSLWHRELAGTILHIKKNTEVKGGILYGGILVAENNPLLPLLEGAVDAYIEEVNNQKH